MTDQPRNIVICCDGTANEPKADGATNVFELVRIMREQPNQLIYYDPGLGTESAPGAQTHIVKSTTKLLGLAFGFGLRKNIADAYRYLMNHYQPGDRVYLFGFSRGAYTARAIAGMLHTVGLLHSGTDNLLNYAIRKYTQQGAREWDNIAAFKSALCRPVSDSSPRYSVPVHFLGVWDTVKAVGLFRRSVQLPYTRLLPNVRSGRHAVALGEKRSKYRPDLWKMTGATGGDVQTVWFSGVHADVGGGYASNERGLADIALRWMLDGAESHGLRFDRDKFENGCKKRQQQVQKQLSSGQQADGALARSEYERGHNPLLPYWWIATWSRRKVPKRAWVHESVVEFMARNPTAYRYAPLDALLRLGEKKAHIEDRLLLLRHGGAILIQTISAEEAKYFESNGLPDASADVLQSLCVAGIGAWQAKLDACLKNGDLQLNAKSQAKAETLLANAADAIDRGCVKGDNGAFEQVNAFLRMSSLKNSESAKAARTHIIESAAFLGESLSECTPP